MSDQWVETTLGQLAVWRGGLTPSMSRPDFWMDGDIPWVSSKEVVGGTLSSTEKRVTANALDETSLRLVEPGSVVVVVRSGILLHTFPVAFVPFATTVNQDVKAATPLSGVDGRFLAYLIESCGSDILQRYRKTGTTVQSVNVPALLKHEVRLPPIPVQRRIVDLMTHLDSHLANLRAERETARALEESVLLELFPQQLWDESQIALSDCAEVFDCEHKTAPQADDAEAVGVSVGTRDIKDGLILADGAKRVSQRTMDQWSRRVRVGVGDIIMAREAPVGPLAYVDSDQPMICLGQRTVLLRPTQVNGQYLAGLLRSPVAQAWMREQSAGLTVAHLNVADIKRMPLPAVPSKQQQSDVAAAVEALLTLRVALDREVAELARSRSALLAALLSGDVTASDDASEQVA